MLRSGLAAVTVCLLAAVASADTVTLYTPAAGDATYAWNTKYGPYGYGVGGTSMDISLYFGAPYGNDHRVSIFVVPIAALAGQSVTAAELTVQSLGFDTGYFYGSARIGWLDVGTTVVTGDVVADGLGPASTACPGGMTLFDTGIVAGTAGAKTFDVLTHVLADLAAGRNFSTFVLSGSRDTWGALVTAEGGSGPYIVATVPEPASMGLLALAGLALLRRRSTR